MGKGLKGHFRADSQLAFVLTFKIGTSVSYGKFRVSVSVNVSINVNAKFHLDPFLVYPLATL